MIRPSESVWRGWGDYRTAQGRDKFKCPYCEHRFAGGQQLYEHRCRDHRRRST